MKLKHQIVGLIGLGLVACGGSDFLPVNSAPTISAIADLDTTANETSTAIAFTVADEQVSILSLSAVSDNQKVVPDENLTVSGSGGIRYLTITPLIDTLGDAFITVVATDRVGLSAGTSFLLTVNPKQMSMQQFTRATYAEAEADDPALINAVAFDQDAEDDDFADLLSQ